MSNKDPDLVLLFEGPVPKPPPKRTDLVEDLGVVVELVPGVEHSFASIEDARVVLNAVRPRRLPRITKFRPIHYWIEMEAGKFAVVEYSSLGESRRGSFGTVNEAWQHLMALRRAAKTGALDPRITEL